MTTKKTKTIYLCYDQSNDMWCLEFTKADAFLYDLFAMIKVPTMVRQNRKAVNIGTFEIELIDEAV